MHNRTMIYNFLFKLFQSTGWKRRFCATILGVLATATLPPLFLTPLLIPAFSGLLLMILCNSTARQSFWDGWWWGLGYFTSGLYWICISLYVEPEKFAWLTPFALFGLPSILSIYTGLVTLLLHKLTRRHPHKTALSIAFFPVLWVLGEYTRAHLFTGFPWNLTGYAWNVTDVTLQGAALWSIYGQSWVAVSVAILPVALFWEKSRNAFIAMGLGAVLFAFFLTFGFVRLKTPTEYTETNIRIVQANIPQSLKFDPKTMLEGLRKHTQLTQSSHLNNIDVVIWPETAIPYVIQAHSTLTNDLGSMLPPHTLLLSGGIRAEGKDKDWKAWNTALVINRNGEIVASYDKHHLVPFGEYVPLRNILPLDAIAGGMRDFENGPGPKTLFVPSLPAFSPLICYEAIFPSQAQTYPPEAKWLVNITNDAWFGYSTGPFQHMEMARTRAVEEGLPLVRAANTGISLVTDSYGRKLFQLPLGISGIIDTRLPSTASDRFTKIYFIIMLLVVQAGQYFILKYNKITH